MNLRPYQINCLTEVYEHFQAGVTRQLIVQATGTGKAVQAAMVPTVIRMPKNRRALFLVHRDELAFQAAEKFTKYNPHLTVGIEKADHRAGDADVVVASVQTIGKAKEIGDHNKFWEYCERIKQFNPDDFALVQADEAHHIPKANTWLSVLRYFRVLCGEPNEDTSKLLCGWTATPNRTDNLGLEVIFRKIVSNYGIREASSDGWLAPIKAYRVETEVDLSRVHTIMGDFDSQELTDLINTPERNELIARKYLEIAPPGPSIFFTSSIQHSFDLAEVMRKHGVRIYPLSGKTPTDERKRFIRLIKDGAIDGLASCGVLNEGTDIPAAVAAFMVKPTKSGLLYRQMCLDSKTEVLTSCGWRGMRDLTKGNYVASYKIGDGRIEWCLPTSLFSRPVEDGENFYSISSPHLDIRVTDQHDLVFKGASSTSRNWAKRTAQKLSSKKQGWLIPVSGIEQACGLPLTNSELRLIGLFTADGWINKKIGTMNISQSANSALLGEIEGILHDCGLGFRKYVRNRKSNFPNASPIVNYAVPFGRPRTDNRHLSGWKHLERYLDKSLSPAMEGCTPEQLSHFLYGLNLGDGCKSPTSWNRRTMSITAGNNKVFADALQSLCVRRGYRCNVSAQSYNQSPLYMMYIKPATAATVGGTSGEKGRSRLVREEAGPGEMVWCMSTIHGTLVTRRNGKVAIMGNCGRVLRQHPSPEEIVEMQARGEQPKGIKEAALVIDFVDNTGRHSLVVAPTLFGLREKFDAGGKDLLKQVEEIEAAEAENPTLDLRSCRNLDAVKTSLRELDLLKPPETPEEIRRISKFTWLREGVGSYHLGLMNGEMISVREDTLGGFEVHRHVKGVKTKLYVATSLKEALVSAEVEIPDRDRHVMLATASWRREPPTDKQVSRLFTLDKKMRDRFRNSTEFLQFALQSYHGGDSSWSRGEMSRRISVFETRR